MTADNKPTGGPTATRLSTHVRQGLPASTLRALAAALLATAAPLAGGCGGASGEFYVVQNQVAGPGCMIPAAKGALYQGEGTLDIRVPTTGDAAYLLLPLLQNDLPAEGAGGVEPNRIALRGFEVDIHFVDGPVAAAELFAGLETPLVRYQSPWSGSLDPAGGTAAAATSAFPAETARRLRDSNVLSDGSFARVDVQVRAFGDKLGGRIKSDVFTYPIKICDGCLIRNVSACPVSGPALQGGVCNAGQDAPVDCCTDGAELICPATSTP